MDSFKDGYMYKYADPQKSMTSLRSFVTNVVFPKRAIYGIPFPTMIPVWWKWQLEIFMSWRYLSRNILENILFHPRFFMVIGLGCLVSLAISYFTYYLTKIKSD
jgi:hypothetical protein